MSAPVVALAAVSAALVAMGVSAIAVPPRPRLAPRVRPYTIGARVGAGRSADLADFETTTAPAVVRLVLPPLSTLAGRASRLVDRSGEEALRRRLRQAGLTITPPEYRLRVMASTAVLGAAGAVIGGVLLRSPMMTAVLAGSAMTFGATRWRGRVDRAIAERRERTRLELYTVNQLLAMHVRAGAGPVQAVQRVVDRGTAIVVDELDEALGWMQHGMAEADAFRRAAELTPEPSAARTYKLFAASAERGSDLGGALRALSEDLRDARREELRRLATKRRAAMLVPIIAVLAPIMLLFIAAPIPSMLFGSR